MGQRAKAAITETDSGLGTARVVADYTGGTAQQEATFERRARQDLEAGFGSAGFPHIAIEGSPRSGYPLRSLPPNGRMTTCGWP
jgi:hypothetical protein